MNFHLRSFKASIIFAVLIFSIILACMPAPVSARGIFNSVIDMDYDQSVITGPIKPEEDVLRIPIYIDYYISGLGSGFVIPFFSASTANVYLTVENAPSYMAATLSKGLVNPFLRTKKPETPESAVLTITFNQDAPAFQTATVDVVAKTQDLPPISGVTQRLSIPIIAGYYQDFNYDYTPQKEIGAGEIVKFPIKVTGYANARSKLIFKIENPPDRWSPSINTLLTLGTRALGQNATGTVDFVVQSPLDFGYHNEVGVFRIQITSYAVGHETQGIQNTTYLDITIRSRGFSTPGFESGLSIIALITVISIVYAIRRKRT